MNILTRYSDGNALLLSDNRYRERDGPEYMTAQKRQQNWIEQEPEDLEALPGADSLKERVAAMQNEWTEKVPENNENKEEQKQGLVGNKFGISRASERCYPSWKGWKHEKVW